MGAIDFEQLQGDITAIKWQNDQILKVLKVEAITKTTDKWIQKKEAMALTGLKAGAFDARVKKGIFTKHVKGYLLSELMKI